MRRAAAGAGARPRPGGVRRGGAAGPASSFSSSCARLPVLPVPPPAPRGSGAAEACPGPDSPVPGAPQSHGAAKGGGARALPGGGGGGGERQASAAASGRCRGLGAAGAGVTSPWCRTVPAAGVGARCGSRCLSGTGPVPRGTGAAGPGPSRCVWGEAAPAPRRLKWGTDPFSLSPGGKTRAPCLCVCWCYSTTVTPEVHKVEVAESAVG